MTVTVRPVRSDEDFEGFLAFGPQVHRDEPHWFSLPREMYRSFFDREVAPYFEHADAEYLMAEREGELVGHVVAHIDHGLSEFKANRWLFGGFRADNDQEVADALLGQPRRGCANAAGTGSWGRWSSPASRIPGC